MSSSLIPFPQSSEPDGAALAVVATDTSAASPIESLQEQADDALLADLQRRALITDGIDGMAQLLYRLRAVYIGGMCLPWGLLTEGQRTGYKAEIEQLIKEIK